MPYLNDEVRVHFLLVVGAVSATLHVHVFSVGVVELTVAQLAEERDELTVAVEGFLNVLVAHWLYSLLSRQQYCGRNGDSVRKITQQEWWSAARDKNIITSKSS